MRHGKRLHFIALLSALILAASLTSRVAIAALSVQTRAILDETKRLSVEDEADQALKSLNSKPRAEILKAYKEALKQGAPWSEIAARGSMALDTKELLPELKNAALTQDSWELLLALRALTPESARAETAKILTAKLPSLQSTSQIAVVESLGLWNQPLGDAQFKKLLLSESTGVRRAVAQQFFVARNVYSESQQRERFKLLFATEGYQLRRDSMLTFSELPKADRAKLSNAVSPNLCAKESNEEVKPVCEKLVKLVKGDRS